MSTCEVINFPLALRYSFACDENINLHSPSKGMSDSKLWMGGLGRYTRSLLRHIHTFSSIERSTDGYHMLEKYFSLYGSHDLLLLEG